MNPYIPSPFSFDPDEWGHFGKFGGRYVPETLMPILIELDAFYKTLRFDETFWHEVHELSEHYVGRPSPLYHAKKLSAELNATILLKREDLNHTGAHKINNTIVQGLMAKRMGKTKIIAETGAGQHGVASATVAALMGLECEVFMGAKDVERQKLNVFRMKLLGAKVHAVESGSSTLKDAMNDAIRHWVTNARDTFYIIGTAAGPHPYPLMVRDFQAIISDEAKKQVVAQKFDMPDYVLACIGGGSNALGMFAHFIEEEKTQCIGIEAGGKGLDSGEHGASLALGKPGVLHGQLSYLLQSDEGQVEEAYSISAGLDYPGIGPEHSYLMEEGKVRYDNVTDDEAMDAFVWLSRAEGIVPAFESAHAIAYLKKIPKEELQGKTVVISLSGRGDKDMIQAMDILKDRL
ncbi:MAG: Tryptophan synthase beta chain (EC [uncultured Sulfurovum sp.]|uniref:Tryptophan synthase beta chain n=1 Tax=uncultured Sulfurovum sp. TaxID=269237 RepID=A0A6S6T107_9BACT|nr:MAG: Tryptophan synthase beta chain (EC [uncultured Sulfurovum sp.]